MKFTILSDDVRIDQRYAKTPAQAVERHYLDAGYDARSVGDESVEVDSDAPSDDLTVEWYIEELDEVRDRTVNVEEM